MPYTTLAIEHTASSNWDRIMDDIHVTITLSRLKELNLELWAYMQNVATLPLPKNTQEVEVNSTTIDLDAMVVRM